MAITITQQPATASLAQSPMIFTVSENTDVVYSSSMQYCADLYYWTGSLNQSGSKKYTLVKYPNDSLVGIFDVSRIMNSTLTDLAVQNTSNVKYYACDFYWQYKSGNSFITSSKTRSNTFKALDGYSIFPEPIGQQIVSKSVHWPIMSDGPSEQTFLVNTSGRMSVYTGTAGGTVPDRIKYTSYIGNTPITSNTLSVLGNTSSSFQVATFPIADAENDWPFGPQPSYDFTVQAFIGTTPLGQAIRFNNACRQKYPNVRLKWKNRYGQFDYFNFYMVNRQSFSTTTRTYQPQLGSWQSSNLSYNDYDSSKLNYISDSNQSISVNTFWIDESYNDIFKQLMVSDEIYWYYLEEQDENVTPDPNDVQGLKPITIKTNTIVFKTNVVDKLIQYQFDFDYGQAYKLLL